MFGISWNWVVKMNVVVINKKMNCDLEDNQLRSKKVRILLGNIPNSLSWIGIIVISTIVICLCLVVCLVPYPYDEYGENILTHILKQLH